ncbi:MAG TPA: DUF4105 domain-containing protein [Burkholderiales bacterium]
MTRALLCLLLFGLPLAAEANDYLNELIAAARAKRLADAPQWHALLHYRPNVLFPGVESHADDPEFFNAPDGKTNPAGELEATLAAFFSTVVETPERQNPQCRFIARYHWLKQELGFDPARLPEQPCARYRAWRAALNPQALTLVFPAAYLNNPASLYGHTLLRVDARDQDERTRLLAYAINYAAATNETSGLVFAVKGIFGGYPGLFSISPYYAKVTEYNDLENRDIWEYELDFTGEEIERILMHVWELGPVRFDYYFFDENCSYHLLSLFDVARPELRLAARFPLWVVPADTVRAVTEEPGLLRRATYRPARSTILRHRAARLDAAQVALAQQLARSRTPLDQGPITELPEVERARVLELAFEYLEYERLRGRVADNSAAAARLRELLLARSRLAVGDESPPPAPAVRPDQGHRSARAGFGIGRARGETFQELQLRPAYHDLLDPEEGYNRGAGIEFFALRLRHHARDDALRLQQLDLVSITSLSPRDQLLKPVSWRVGVGFARKTLASGAEPLVFRAEGGAGLAWEPASQWLVYGLAEAALEASGYLENDYALGAGVAAGALVDLSARWRAELAGRARRYAAGDVHSATELTLRQRLRLGPDTALRLDVVRRREASRTTREVLLAWHYYF